MSNSPGSPHKQHPLPIFEKINELKVGTVSSFFGRVVAKKEPRKTSGADYILSLVVVDDSFADNPDITMATPSGLSVNIFRHSLDELPNVSQLGDIIAFRRMKIQIYNNNLQALSTRYSAWSTIKKNSAGRWTAFDSTQRDWSDYSPILQAITDLPIGTGNNSISFISNNSQPSQVLSQGSIKPFNRPLLTVSGVKPIEKQFFDIALRVVKVLHSNDYGKFIFLGTDFTQNPLLPESMDDLPDWSVKQSLLKVTLWDEHAMDAQKLKIGEGSHVMLTNVIAKMYRNTTTGYSTLEATLHGNQNGQQTGAVKILRDSEPIVKQIRNQESGFHDLQNIKEESIIEAIEKEKTQQITLQKTPTKSPMKSPAKSASLAKIGSPDQSRKKIPKLDVSVRTVIDESKVLLSTLLAVRAFPADHGKFCVRARCVDVFPLDAWSYIRAQCGSCNGYTELGLLRHFHQCAECGAEGAFASRYIFVFGLMLDDGTSDLPVIVAEEDAEHFLGIRVEPSEACLQEISFRLVSLMNDTSISHLFCLQSYRVSISGSNESALRYRLLRTRLQLK